MSDEARTLDVARRLAGLLKAGVLSGHELQAAERSLRQLVDPLRMMIFGMDPKLAVSLLNLTLGERIVPRMMRGAQIQFSHSDETFADLQFRDGTKKRCTSENFAEVLEETPSRIRIGSDLPVLRKLSIMVLANSDGHKTSEEIEKYASRSDFMIWLDGDIPDEVRNAWERLPERLLGHSYLIHTPGERSGAWSGLENEFVDVLGVDSKAALDAKTRETGADKDAFKAAGGADFVRMVKSEIQLLRKAALDTADVLLLRHAFEENAEVADEKADISDASIVGQTQDLKSHSQDEAVTSTPLQDEPLPEPVQETLPDQDTVDEPQAPVAEKPEARATSHRPNSVVATRARSVPATKTQATARVKSRPISVSSLHDTVTPKRPVKPVRQNSRARKSRPSQTPWSLGL